MDCLRVKVNQCEYKEKDSRLKEQFINGINDIYMVTKIVRELTGIKETDEVKAEHVLSLPRG